ncbi:MAG: hypothetical protein PHN82_08935 [bacterium]|nr:hypothetical protein [bacterium]
MRKAVIASVVLAIACLGCAGMRCPVTGKYHGKEKGGMWRCCPMHGEMAVKMMKPAVFTTQDGGVILLMGNKLAKYDRDLELQKEIELKCDKEGMKKMMEEMCEASPQCRMMRGKWEKK